MELRPVGRAAVLVEVADSHEAVSLAAWARDRALARDVVPGARSVLLDGLADRDTLVEVLGDWTPGEVEAGPEIELPVTYDGPDLDDVAAQWGCDVDQVVARHERTEFVAAFCGFSPGFAYLEGLEVDVPRLSTPRTRVPAGSVALAGRWCGVYPTDSPGGWRIIGHTEAEALGPRTRPARPALARDEGPLPRRRSVVMTLLVREIGASVLVQDRGRPGLAHLGVPRSGALDPPASTLANRLVGNGPDAACLEVLLGGLAVEADEAVLGRGRRRVVRGGRRRPTAWVRRAGAARRGRCAPAGHPIRGPAVLPRRRRWDRRGAGPRVAVDGHARTPRTTGAGRGGPAERRGARRVAGGGRHTATSGPRPAPRRRGTSRRPRRRRPGRPALPHGVRRLVELRPDRHAAGRRPTPARRAG